jgi:hypothetical protein
MNRNLLAVIKQIVTEQGDGILSEQRRVSAFFADLAKDEPKPQRNAFVKCLEHGFAQTLKSVPEQDRTLCKQRLAQRLNEEEGLDPRLCEETLELLAAVLFGEEQKKKENVCKNCGKELQEGWKTCPYCSTPVAVMTSQIISSAISSGSGSWGYGIEQIKPATPTVSNNTVDVTRRCFGCSYATINNRCTYYNNLSIQETAKYNCVQNTTGSTESANQNTEKLTGGQKFLVFLVFIFVGILSYFLFYGFFYESILKSIIAGFFPSIIDVLDNKVKILVILISFLSAFGWGMMVAEQFKKNNAKNKP